MTVTKPTPPDTRPYRRASEPGDEKYTTTSSASQVWHQIGWHGQSGAFYALDEDPSRHEPGSFSPLWLLVDNEPRVPVIEPRPVELNLHGGVSCGCPHPERPDLPCTLPRGHDIHWDGLTDPEGDTEIWLGMPLAEPRRRAIRGVRRDTEGASDV